MFGKIKGKETRNCGLNLGVATSTISHYMEKGKLKGDKVKRRIADFWRRMEGKLSEGRMGNETLEGRKK